MATDTSRAGGSGETSAIVTRVSASTLLGGLALILAAWTASGATGLLGHALRHSLTWLLVLLASLLCWPSGKPRAALFAIGIPIALALTPFADFAVAVFAVTIMASGISSLHPHGAPRRYLSSVALSVGALALFRLFTLSFPLAWLLADRLAQWSGRVAALLCFRPLCVGPTFGGLDFVILASVWYAVWIYRAPSGLRLRRAGLALGFLVVTHLLYLSILAYAADVVAAIPKADPKTPDGPWLSLLRAAVPWNVPAAGALLHALAIGLVVRRTAWCTGEPGDRPPRVEVCIPCLGAVLAAAAIGVLATLCVGPTSLRDQKIVLYEKGYLNWLKPKHGEYGRLSIGMYGLLPHFINSLGGRCLVSPELSEEDLRDAEALVMMYPNEPWEPGTLERIRRFVERGGSLWVLGEHTIREKEGGARFNEVLEKTGMHVLFDCAEFAIGGWLQSYDALAHRATLGFSDQRNPFGIVIGASITVAYPACPVILGRWGWSDWGDEKGNAMMGNGRYDAGERLGDVILAAEQKVGRGRIVVFGDTSTLSNGINMGSHEFTSRMFAYLANGAHTPQAGWRLFAAAAALAALLAAIRRDAWRLWSVAMAAAVLAATRASLAAWNYSSTDVLPESRLPEGHGLAYIDAAHQGLYSAESWRDDGLMGIAMAFMRDDYLTLTLQDFTPERLGRADLLLSVAPGRPFSVGERKAVRQFVEKGGTFILTVGYDQAGPSTPLLRDLGFEIGDGTRPEGVAPGPKAMGFFKSPFYNAGDYMSYVRFYSTWPVYSPEPDAQVLAYGTGNIPTILTRRIGKGRVVVSGDSSFVMNRNLEWESGVAFEGMRENPNFWRWLIAYLRGRHWTPPNEAKPAPAAEEGTP